MIAGVRRFLSRMFFHDVIRITQKNIAKLRQSYNISNGGLTFNVLEKPAPQSADSPQLCAPDSKARQAMNQHYRSQGMDCGNWMAWKKGDILKKGPCRRIDNREELSPHTSLRMLRVLHSSSRARDSGVKKMELKRRSIGTFSWHQDCRTLISRLMPPATLHEKQTGSDGVSLFCDP